MRTTFLILAAAGGLLTHTQAAPNGQTMLQALKMLPKDAPARLARVQAFEGGATPGGLAPERWYFLVHDTREENGLHEYVVANGELVATRSVSQFAEELKAEDIIGSEQVKVDSDRAANIAKQYAEANKLVMATCNYELKKDGEAAVPQWRVTCLDDKGKEVGQLSVTATKGTVVQRDGFAVEPQILDPKAQLALAEAQYKRDIAAYRAQQARKAAQRQQQTQPQPAQGWVAEEPRQGFFQRAGNSVGRMFGGGGR